MIRPARWGRLFWALALPAFGGSTGNDIVFRSEVSLVRVDVRVSDRYGRSLSGLTRDDFELREEGRVRPILSFAAEDMPVDLVLLIDVSTSMRPHIEKVAAAMNDALAVLGENDRVALLVFDRRVRTRDRFLSRRREIELAMDRLLRDESFRGGTDITLGLYEAIRFINREARREVRKAIVIVTDDYTERERDVEGVTRALLDGDIVLSALLAPDAMNQGRRSDPAPDWDPRAGGPWPTGGGWPGRGGVGRWPWPGGGRPPGGVVIGTGAGLRRAGTDQIAEASGGAALPVLHSDSLPESFRQIRQRYALYFAPAEEVRAGEHRRVTVTLTSRRFAMANLHYRPYYRVASDASAREQQTTPALTPVESVARREAPPEAPIAGRSAADPPEDEVVIRPPIQRRTAGPTAERPPAREADSREGEAGVPRRGWRRLSPGEKP